MKPGDIVKFTRNGFLKDKKFRFLYKQSFNVGIFTPLETYGPNDNTKVFIKYKVYNFWLDSFKPITSKKLLEMY